MLAYLLVEPSIDPNISRKKKILSEHLEKQAPRVPVPPLSLVEFNLSGLCNRVCAFCPRVDPKVFPNVNEHIPIELYEKIVGNLRDMEFTGTILYSAFGEPLLYKNIERLIEISRRVCPAARVEIVCNGDFVTPEKLKSLFDAGLTVMSISMYDGPEQNAKFRAMQKEAGLSDEQVILRIRYLSKEEHYGITLSNRAGMITMEDLGVAKPKEPLRQSCYYPFYQILVDYDGSVLLCPHDWGKNLIVGNLKEQSVAEIWNNAIYKHARLKLADKDRGFSPCNVCDVNGTHMGKSHYEKWMEFYAEPKHDPA